MERLSPATGCAHDTRAGGKTYPRMAQRRQETAQRPAAIVDRMPCPVVVLDAKGDLERAGRLHAPRMSIDTMGAEFVARARTVGKRETFEAKIYTIFDNTTQYGVQFTHYMRDEAMNPIVYRGTKKLAKEGDTVCFDATVKSHWTGADGRVATYVNRPKIR